MSRAVLYLASLSFVVLGLVSLVQPAALFGRFGVPIPNGDVATEIRTVYGGLLVGPGLLFGYLARRGLTREGLVGASLVAGGFPVGRLVGLAVDRGHTSATYVSLLVDAILFFITLAALVVEVRKPRLAPGPRGERPSAPMSAWTR